VEQQLLLPEQQQQWQQWDQVTGLFGGGGPMPETAGAAAALRSVTLDL